MPNPQSIAARLTRIRETPPDMRGKWHTHDLVSIMHDVAADVRLLAAMTDTSRSPGAPGR